MSPEDAPSRRLPRPIWRILVAAAGSLLILAGALLLVLPGPGLLVIALGLGVLATEFEWARRLSRRILALVRRRGQRGSRPAPH